MNIPKNWVSISIPLDFHSKQLTMYDVPHAKSKPYQSGKWVGNVEEGGSCNFNTLVITPHCNGTHTECIGHIVKNSYFIFDVIKNPIFRSILISVQPTLAKETHDSYQPSLQDDDLVIDQNMLIQATQKYKTNDFQGIIIRTLPNEENKKTTDYNENPPAFFTNEAMKWIFEQKFLHLMTDLPSVDKAYDDGKLSNHRIFWNVPAGISEVVEGSIMNKTISELLYIPNQVSDGEYLTLISIPPFLQDAAPSSIFIAKD